MLFLEIASAIVFRRPGICAATIVKSNLADIKNMHLSKCIRNGSRV